MARSTQAQRAERVRAAQAIRDAEIADFKNTTTHYPSPRLSTSGNNPPRAASLRGPHSASAGCHAPPRRSIAAGCAPRRQPDGRTSARWRSLSDGQSPLGGQPGGTGKTVLATAVVDDPELRLAFPDGVAWLVVGRSMAGAGSIKPSPTGVPPAPAGDHKGHGEERIAWTGKISAIVYDQFGDFEGFRLATEDCERPMTARRSVPCLSRLPDRLSVGDAPAKGCPPAQSTTDPDRGTHPEFSFPP